VSAVRNRPKTSGIEDHRAEEGTQRRAPLAVAFIDDLNQLGKEHCCTSSCPRHR
jgi:hypothetical protein